MVNAQLYSISDVQLHDWIRKGSKEGSAEYVYPSEAVMQTYLWNNHHAANTVSDLSLDIFDIIVKYGVLFSELQNNGSSDRLFAPIHENLRDTLAARYLYDDICAFINNKHLTDVPEKWTSTDNENVLTTLARFLSDSQLSYLWSILRDKFILSGKKTTLHDTIQAEWLLRLLGYHYNFDYSRVDFSSMDLSALDLSICHPNNSIQLNFSKEENGKHQFKGARVNKESFISHGHSRKVNKIAFYGKESLKCVTAGDDNKICIWDVASGRLLDSITQVSMFKTFQVFKYEEQSFLLYGTSIYYIITVLPEYNLNNAISLKNAPSVTIKIARDNLQEDQITTMYFSQRQETCIIGYASGRLAFLKTELFPYIIKTKAGISNSNLIDMYYYPKVKTDEYEYLVKYRLKSYIGVPNYNYYELELSVGRINKIIEVDELSLILVGTNDGALIFIDADDLTRYQIFQTEINWQRSILDNYKRHSFVLGSKLDESSIWSSHLLGITDIQPFFHKMKTYCAISGTNGKIYLWDILARKELKPAIQAHQMGVNTLAIYYQDGTIPCCVAASDDHTITRWNLVTRKPIGSPMVGHKDWVAGAEVFGNICVSYSYDGTLRLFDLATGNEIANPLRGHADWITSIALYKQNNKLLCVSGGADGSIGFWSLVPFTQRNHFRSGVSNGIRKVKTYTYSSAFSMLKTIASTLNGSSLSSNGNIETRCLIACQDGTVRIYSLNQQRIIRILEGHVGWVNSVIVFCNGHACITCGSDRTALVWNLDTYEKTATLIGHNGWVLDADVLETDSASPKFTVVTACYDGSLRKFTIKNPLLQQDKDDVTFQILSPTLTIKSHDGGIKFVDFYDKTASSPKCLTGGYDGKIIKYNLKRINSRESNYQVLTNNTGGYDGKIIEYNRKRINSREFNYQVLTNNIDTRNIKDIGVFCRLSKPYAISADASRNVIQWDLAGGTIKSIDYVFSHKITEIIGIKILDHRYFIGTIFLGVFALFGCAIDEDTIIPDNSFIALAADNKGNLDLDLPLPKFETPTCFDIFINENEYNIITGTKSGQIVLFKLSKAECLVQADRENIYKLILQYAFNISQGSSIVDNNLKGSVIDRKEIDWFTKNGAYV